MEQFATVILGIIMTRQQIIFNLMSTKTVGVVAPYPEVYAGFLYGTLNSMLKLDAASLIDRYAR